MCECVCWGELVKEGTQRATTRITLTRGKKLFVSERNLRLFSPRRLARRHFVYRWMSLSSEKGRRGKPLPSDQGVAQPFS